MNLYLRYFDRETLVSNVDDAIVFLSQIDEICLTPAMEKDVREYMASEVYYPKRYKVRPRVYFILIKTDAATMSDFKQKKAVHTPTHGKPVPQASANAVREGWYEGTMDFKRVVMVPVTGKFEYRDTRFVVQCKAVSGQDCYNRMVDHLRQRVDVRSQFPSIKGKNFKFRFLGDWK